MSLKNAREIELYFRRLYFAYKKTTERKKQLQFTPALARVSRNIIIAIIRCLNDEFIARHPSKVKKVEEQERAMGAERCGGKSEQEKKKF